MQLGVANRVTSVALLQVVPELTTQTLVADSPLKKYKIFYHHIVFCLPSSLVSLSYLILGVIMHSVEQHLCMSSTFSVTQLNGTYHFSCCEGSAKFIMKCD